MTQMDNCSGIAKPIYIHCAAEDLIAPFVSKEQKVAWGVWGNPTTHPPTYSYAHTVMSAHFLPFSPAKGSRKQRWKEKMCVVLSGERGFSASWRFTVLDAGWCNRHTRQKLRHFCYTAVKLKSFADEAVRVGFHTFLRKTHGFHLLSDIWATEAPVV